MAFVIFLVVVAFVAALTVSIVKATIFSLVLLVSVVVLPIIVMLILGLLVSPITVYMRKRAEKSDDYSEAAYMAKSGKYGTVLSQTSQITGYLLILVISHKLGKAYLWASLSGIGVKSIFDYMWGDLPFQKQKFATDEFGNTVAVHNTKT